MTHWLLILLGIASTFGVLLLDWMLCTPFPGYGFEAPGMGWILCVGLYNGTLLGCALALFHDAIVSAKSDRLKAVSGLAVCTLVTTLLWWSNPNTCGDNLRDQLVRRIGYCFFYVPLFSKQPVDDRPLSPNISVAIRPHNRVTAITSNGVLKI